MKVGRTIPVLLASFVGAATLCAQQPAPPPPAQKMEMSGKPGMMEKMDDERARSDDRFSVLLDQVKRTNRVAVEIARDIRRQHHQLLDGNHELQVGQKREWCSVESVQAAGVDSVVSIGWILWVGPVGAPGVWVVCIRR